jgi:hypothetical protein
MTLISATGGGVGWGKNIFRNGRKAGGDPSKSYEWMIAADRGENKLTRMTRSGNDGDTRRDG